MEKKGISPLIATVLLVAFSVALGAVVMNFTSSQVHDITGAADRQIDRGIQCSMDMSISVLEIEDERFICYNRSGANNLEVIIENQGSIKAEGMQFFLLDATESPFTYNSQVSVGPHNRTKYNIPLSGFTFPPAQIVISPILTIQGDEFEICTDSRIDILEIEKC